MTEQPRTFTAPTSGRYHFVSGQEPHLAEDCAEACGACGGAGAGDRQVIKFETVPASGQARGNP